VELELSIETSKFDAPALFAFFSPFSRSVVLPEVVDFFFELAFLLAGIALSAAELTLSVTLLSDFSRLPLMLLAFRTALTA
jgi:hypothetical protein